MPHIFSENKKYIVSTIAKIERSVYTKVSELNISAWKTKEPVSFDNRKTGEKLTLKKGDTWGDLLDCAWFNFTGELPSICEEQSVVLMLDVGGEMCVADNSGNPIQGLTAVHSGFGFGFFGGEKITFDISKTAKRGEEIDLWADAGCNDLFAHPGYTTTGQILHADIAIVNEELRKLYYDFMVLNMLSDNLDKQTARYARIVMALTRACDKLITYNKDEIADASAILSEQLAKKNGDVSFTITAIGQAHLDLAWLWPVRETIRKGARTFSTALHNMKKYPEYKFGASQPQLYQWIKEHYPTLYEQVKEKIREGRWEVQGALWVECDTNIPSGESFVRQLMYGKKFIKDEFGLDVDVVWLPDTFGYSGSLPQIMAKSGIKYFMTQKLSWNNFNTHPHHTFLWRGIDNSEVLVHILPENTYNSLGAPHCILDVERNFFDKGICDEALMLFGIGDGGGGPGENHLECLAREVNLNGLTPVNQGMSSDFFKRQEHFRNDLSIFHGELYLEKHQGTLTTEAKCKLYNRKMETLLHDLELIAVLAGESDYPKAEIDEIWKEVLLYQFHDVIPGSSIDRVYDETYARYEILIEKTLKIIQKTQEKLKKSNKNNSILNTMSWERNEWLEIDGKWKYVTANPLGFTTLNENHSTVTPTISAVDKCIENDILKVSFDNNGQVADIYDKVNKRTVLSGVGNKLYIHPDEGDAWDFATMYERRFENVKLDNFSVQINGGETAANIEYSYGKSKISQKVILKAESRRLDFVTKVDWQESHKTLRTYFPVNIYTTEAKCDIQFGAIKRPTHENTMWDVAKIEVAAQKWVDLSDKGYGVALMSNCKYGYSLNENIMGMTLLRSSKHPGETSDMGLHEFTYSIYPHSGDYVDGYVVQEGYNLIYPLKVVSGEFDIKLPIKISHPNIIVETVKFSEDNNGFIVRMYESAGASTVANVELLNSAHSAELVDLMEENIGKADLDNLEFKPFEIITIKIQK